jgi:hypothetical protein
MPKKITKTSRNTNCLRGMRCPKCGHNDSLNIEATCIFRVTADGMELENTSSCECPNCAHQGTVADFTIEKRNREKAAAAPDLLAAAQALLNQWGEGNLSQTMQALQKAVNAEQRKGC